MTLRSLVEIFYPKKFIVFGMPHKDVHIVKFHLGIILNFTTDFFRSHSEEPTPLFQKPLRRTNASLARPRMVREGPTKSSDFAH